MVRGTGESYIRYSLRLFGSRDSAQRPYAEFSVSELKRMSQLPIVPVPENAAQGKQTTRLLPPAQCYFKDVTKTTFHSKLFVFVDFGTQANQFLSACGTKHEPSVEEIVRILLDNPRQFFQLAEGRDKCVCLIRKWTCSNSCIAAFSGSFATLLLIDASCRRVSWLK